MTMIHLAASLALLWLHLAGLTLVLGQYLPYAIARASGVLLITLLMFFIEHFIGLGNLNGLWPITAILAAASLYLFKQEARSSRFKAAEIAFLLALAYGLIWKFIFPAIYPTSERVTDLYFMANYYSGSVLPPPDHWFAGHRFDFYYAFQHYAAALMGRLFGWDIGFTYNIAFALLMALGLSLAWEFATRFVASRLHRLVLILALALGGTGVSPLLNLFVTPTSDSPISWQANDEMWASARFIGSYDARVNTDLGRQLFPLLTPETKPTPDFEARDLPLENFGYQFFLGDYHPPLGGFFLLFLALALIAWLEQKRSDQPDEILHARFAQSLLALTLPVMLITNTWITPMLAVLLFTWALWRHYGKNPPAWGAIFAGGTLGFLLIYPFLAGFASQAIGTPIRLVHNIDRTPIAQFILLLWPLLALFALALTEKRQRPLAIALVIAFAIMLLLGEFIFVDDPSVGKFERTNTTMKWWGWMWSGALLAAGAMALGSGRRWVRNAAAAVLLLTCSYTINTTQYIWHTPKGDLGKLAGTHWFSNDAPVKDTIQYLSQAPKGIVLENWLGDAYTNQTLFSLYAQQPSLLGWPNHVSLWHGAPQEVWLLNQQIKDFYLDSLPSPLAWLKQNKVQYVVWGRPENTSPAWQTINAAIAAEYDWRPFLETSDTRMGLWIKRQK
ncbi:DUF2298 domain-containing protein [Janthinobacterium sp. B9-8]|uniref:DUF2298 domain-containing protein n=1 Tax=Janthinobacterium sp. B9-8 TaxID=1236179 RepID=UPI00061D2F88|nr:DUF2298 domain-containing protein [Janthinobacterium sp. B9-8]AMC36690.1 hypothetical protein VN23_19915 [Janthinobacterium sp. B9-8]